MSRVVANLGLLVCLCALPACGQSVEQVFSSSGGAASQGGQSSARGGASNGGSGLGGNATGGTTLGLGGAALGLGGASSAGSGGTTSDSGGSPSSGGAGNGGASSRGGTANAGSAALGGSAGMTSAGTGGVAVGLGGAAGANTGGANTGGANTGGASTGGLGGGAPGGPLLQSGSGVIPAFKAAPHCEHIDFPKAFQVDDAELSVQASLLYPGSSTTHAATALWVEAITAAGFDACLAEDPNVDNAHGRSRVDWVAYVTDSVASLGFAAGRQALSADPTSECRTLTLPSDLGGTLGVQATLSYPGSLGQGSNASVVWLEELSSSDFRACAEALVDATGAVTSANLDWLAYLQASPAAGFSAGEHDFSGFNDTSCEVVSTGCQGCQNAQVTANHRRRTEATTTFHDSTLVWVEDFASNGDLTICVRETSASNLSHDGHLSVAWLARKQND